MNPGNLVKTTRASIGIPAGSLALILEKYRTMNTFVYVVEIIGVNRLRRYLERDIRKVS